MRIIDKLKFCRNPFPIKSVIFNILIVVLGILIVELKTVIGS